MIKKFKSIRRNGLLQLITVMLKSRNCGNLVAAELCCQQSMLWNRQTNQVTSQEDTEYINKLKLSLSRLTRSVYPCFYRLRNISNESII